MKSSIVNSTCFAEHSRKLILAVGSKALSPPTLLMVGLLYSPGRCQNPVNALVRLLVILKYLLCSKVRLVQCTASAAVVGLHCRLLAYFSYVSPLMLRSLLRDGRVSEQASSVFAGVGGRSFLCSRCVWTNDKSRRHKCQPNASRSELLFLYTHHNAALASYTH